MSFGPALNLTLPEVPGGTVPSELRDLDAAIEYDQFDLFHSIRFEAVVDAIEAFAAWVRSTGVRSRWEAQQPVTCPQSAPRS
jgi:hypothetical protein